MNSDTNIKVLHISNTNINHDGRIIKEIDTLNKSGLNIEVTGVGAHQNEDKKRSDYGLELEGISTLSLYSETLTKLPRAIKYFLMMFEFTYKAFRFAMKLKPQIVHCHDTFALPTGALLKLKGIKVIYDAHELESNKNGQSKALQYFTLLIEKLCWNRVDAFITVSDKILDWYFEEFSEKKSAVILNAPKAKKNSEEVVCDTKGLRKKFGIEPEANIYVYVGILRTGRGIEKLIEVFKGKGSSHLVFLGYGPMLSQLEVAAKNNSRIHLHPPVAHQDVVSTISDATFGFCMIEDSSLSDYLCLPNKLFEYAQSGLPVVGTDFPEISRVIERHQLGVVVKDTVDDINTIVQKLDSEGYDRKAIDIDLLTWEAQQKRLIKLYKKIM